MKRSIITILLLLAAAGASAQGPDSAWIVPSQLSFSSEPVPYIEYPPVCLVDTAYLGSSNAPAYYTSTVMGGPLSFVSISNPTGYTDCLFEVQVCVNGLGIGIYRDTVVIYVEGVSEPLELAIELEIVLEGPGSDTAYVSPVLQYFTAQQGTNETQSGSVLVYSEPDGIPFSVSVLEDDDGINVYLNQTSGITSDSVTFEVRSTEDMPCGIYSDTLLFELEGYDSPLTSVVYLMIDSCGPVGDRAWVEPPYLWFTAEPTPYPTYYPVCLWDTVQILSTNAPAPYTCSVVGGSETFVVLSKLSGFTDDTLGVAVCFEGLEAGIYVDTVVFSVEGISMPVALPVHLQLAEDTNYAWVEPAHLFYTFDSNGEPPETTVVGIYSTNAPAFYEAYILGGTKTFLTILDSSSVTNDLVRIAVDPSGLSQGIYYDTVAFDVSGCEASAYLSVEVEIGGSSDSTKYRLRNHPNPFNPSTVVRFSLERTANVELTVYDILGRKVVCLHSGTLPAGDHQFLWDGTDSRGQRVGSGVYLSRLKRENETETTKMVLMK